MDAQNKILELQTRISALYSPRDQEYPHVPVVVRTAIWVSFAQRYSEAAKVMSEASPMLWVPALQLAGQAVELALKACLCASKIEPPHKHDLVELYGQVHDTGIVASEFQQACIAHLSHFYFRDFATGTQFKSRYPTSRAEYLGGAVPEQKHFTSLVEDLCRQAQARADVATAALVAAGATSR